jgi:hypothetical protein
MTPDTIVRHPGATELRPCNLLQTPPPQHLRNPMTLTNDELLTMRDNVTRLLCERGIPVPIPPLPPLPPPPPGGVQRQYNAFDNAKYEQIACLSLKPP